MAWPSYGSVLNHDPSANTLAGCVLAIEGCMDPTALNYDPDATVDSGDWCVPIVHGCMLPSWGGDALADGDGGGQSHLALNYDPSATVHNVRRTGHHLEL